MAWIALEQMEFWAYHGCFTEEQVIGTRFMIDLYIETDTSKAELSDDLNDTINYQSVYKVVKNEMQIPSKLLEHLGRRILTSVFTRFPKISYAKIKISKLNPALGGKIGSVSVNLEEKR
ncbi:MAG TPA: dihydroneopterin aldolase [Bacteroidales bacterium]|jgi:dihydroneopterin aldolase|nr:dihydroneopterin aldolase [Bacteroidales bacterium]MDI9574768.1 dihydroneopterin aldolase [Bacteroidota bacterium]OQC61003.1 MAG: Dihydroneopterin aldolase [Bacteroidetes bacterium ADurb.Bin012]MBP9512656.1 dihydroneopterin aldolase [Bacteroidales bacterium]MBP9589199.1 dihydroneopterin aldolase [Bacteroidales bacterium]